MDIIIEEKLKTYYNFILLNFDNKKEKIIKLLFEYIEILYYNYIYIYNIDKNNINDIIINKYITLLIEYNSNLNIII